MDYKIIPANIAESLDGTLNEDGSIKLHFIQLKDGRYTIENGIPEIFSSIDFSIYPKEELTDNEFKTPTPLILN